MTARGSRRPKASKLKRAELELKKLQAQLRAAEAKLRDAKKATKKKPVKKATKKATKKVAKKTKRSAARSKPRKKVPPAKPGKPIKKAQPKRSAVRKPAAKPAKAKVKKKTATPKRSAVRKPAAKPAKAKKTPKRSAVRKPAKKSAKPKRSATLKPSAKKASKKKPSIPPPPLRPLPPEAVEETDTERKRRRLRMRRETFADALQKAFQELLDADELPASYSVLEEPKVWLGRRRVPSYYVTLTVNEMAEPEMVDDLVHRCNEAALAIRESLMNPGNHNGLQLSERNLRFAATYEMLTFGDPNAKGKSPKNIYGDVPAAKAIGEMASVAFDGFRAVKFGAFNTAVRRLIAEATVEPTIILCFHIYGWEQQPEHRRRK